MTTTEKHEDQMIVQYAKISLEDEEEGGLVFEDIGNANQAPEYQWSLVGRFLTDRAINFLAMKNTLASLWRPVKGRTFGYMFMIFLVDSWLRKLQRKLKTNLVPLSPLIQKTLMVLGKSL
ncbi:uncharacterized protein LOC125369194 [Ricinus communis]|uniref:uncharacterized protein LOC125369194 n=1 Tax=Ricinus communis TaxID=3988 RepID=UPI00201B299A|nr:uncharacterized protein LOC125369194 [Ricinus communis]